MEITLSLQSGFPVGTTVKAYPASGWPGGVAPVGSPKGASVAEGVVGSNGSVTLTGLEAKTRYYATAEVGGAYRYVAMYTGVKPSSGGPTLVEVEALLAVKQPLDADLTAIAALETTAYGRALLTQASAAAARSALQIARMGIGLQPLNNVGFFLPCPVGGTSTGATPEKRMMLQPIFVPEEITIDKLVFEVTALAAASKVEVGLFESVNGLPSKRIWKGEAATTTIGVKEITGINTKLVPGLYFIAQVAQGGAPTLKLGSQRTPYLGVGAVDAGSGASGAIYLNTQAEIPAELAENTVYTGNANALLVAFKKV